MTIKDSEYSESYTDTASDAQGDLTHNLETVTHTSNGNETVTHTNNGDFEKNLLSDRTIPVIVLTMNPGIEQIIAPIVVTPQALLVPAMKEVVADAASGGA